MPRGQIIADLLVEGERARRIALVALDERGEEGAAARAARALADDIRRRSGRAVALWDERFTTARTRRAVQEMGGKARSRPGDLDALAAALLLQQYLDARRGTAL